MVPQDFEESDPTASPLRFTFAVKQHPCFVVVKKGSLP